MLEDGPQPEVIRAMVLEGGPHLPRGLRGAHPHRHDRRFHRVERVDGLRDPNMC